MKTPNIDYTPRLIVKFALIDFTRNTRDIFRFDNYITLVPAFRIYSVSSLISYNILSSHIISHLQFSLQLERVNITLIVNNFCLFRGISRILVMTFTDTITNI